MYKIFNLHFTDICNYHCVYCFINKQKQTLSLENIKLIVDNIKRYYDKNNICDGRINLAGGEPLNFFFLQNVIDYIYLQKISISIITNGSLLSEDFISRNKNKIAMIGLSVDSINEQTNIDIGRCDINKKTLSLNDIITICNTIRDKEIGLKLNICVSKYNFQEDFSTFLNKTMPDRLKILQMTIINGTNNSQKDMTVNKKEFDEFCDKYRIFNPVIETFEMMEDGYLIIDSSGNIGINNSHMEKSYNLMKMELSDIVNNIMVNNTHYSHRYE